MQADRSDAPLAVGIDLGTQSVRVVLLEEDGTISASGTAPLSSIRTESVRHEQDPEAWWEALGQAAREATEYLGSSEVVGLAICSTSGTVLFADGGGKPLTPALMYNDGRAEEETRVAQEAGEEVWDSLGYRMQRSFALPKLLWMLRAGMGEGASRLMHQADFVASRLVGEPVATDWSHALKTGYDLVNERWPEEVLERLEVPVKLLPPVVRPGSTIGEVSEAAALDVYDEESPPKDSRLFKVPRLVLSPHIAGTTKETAMRPARIAAEEVGRYACGEKLVNVANREAVGDLA